ncbi:class I SAM-dependent RNA methyltransferase [Aquabacter spiritensis]|uniref:23S rRNA m(5)U-1939 methyltransferase n=1 Tax=Aquabacter spiritensis TaxID=933073 RepID=A0A4V6NZL9_9HYPH|nr:class I SAM-dependent RNA methyltransferase [Aquabacter spiritensis]TCT07578.1 23S rRNA m(5)U-1939 methyltransferase [Aquabacter spiritensis]
MIEAVIARVGAQGDGIAETEDGPLFAPFTLPGERVEGRRDKDMLRVERILAASDARVTPECGHFGRCGGCLLQHWGADPYLRWKRDLVVFALAREGVETEVRPLVDAHGAGRRRAIFHARQAGAQTIVGFAERKSHTMIPIVACPVLAPALANALPAARALAEALAPLKKPLDLHVTATDAGMDVDVRGSGPVPPMIAMDLAAIAARFGLARLTRHGELVAQREPPFVMMGGARVTLPPASFLQATQAGEDALAGLVAEALAGASHVADLFCGVGTFALRLAARARVAAFESNGGAIAALARAGAATAGLKRIDAEVRDLFRRPLLAEELARYDAVAIDPPRQGAEAQARELGRARLARVAYVSCSVATFARDAKILTAAGFDLRHVVPIDQFRYSPHVELVGVFER